MEQEEKKLRRLIYQYLYCLQSIQEYNEDTEEVLTPYALETKRQEIHYEIVEACIKYFDLKDNDISEILLRSKEIFSNLDKVCSCYSRNKEWELKNESDITHTFLCIWFFLDREKTIQFLNGELEAPDFSKHPSRVF